MRTLKTTLPISLFLFLAFAVMLSSCSGDDNSLIQDVDEFTLTAKVDGVALSLDNVIGGAAPDEADIFLITTVGGASISIALNNPVSEGTFSTGVSEETILIYQESESIDGWWLANENLGTGTVTITNNNSSLIEGTFSFTAFNGLSNTTKEITEGRFRAKKIF